LEQQNVKGLLNTKETEDNNGKDLVVAYPCKNYSILFMTQEHGDLNLLTERHGKPTFSHYRFHRYTKATPAYCVLFPVTDHERWDSPLS
jgi:hypothetical protein